MPTLRRHPKVTAVALVLLGLVTVWSVKLVRLQLSVAQNREFWSSPQGQAGGLTYVALGDSAAQGIGASRPERGYVGLLADRLRDQTGRPVQVVNLSRSGARLADVLQDQLPRLRELDADIVTVAIGGNDVRHYDQTTFRAQLDQLTRGLPSGAFVADLPFFMHGRWEDDAQEASDLVTAAAPAAGLVSVPLHQTQRSQGWSAMFTQFAADWFHPNDRGHRVWADAFWQVMRDSDAVRPAGRDRPGGTRT